MDSGKVARQLVVPPELAGQRLDRVVAALAPDLTRSAAQRLLKDGHILLDGTPAKGSEKVAAGQGLVLHPPEVRPLEVAAEDIPLDVVYEDEHLLVVNKAPGMVVHPAHGHHSGTLVNALLAHCRLSAGSDNVRPGIVHRLDKDTSGLLLVAKDDHVHARLTRMVEDKDVTRRYLALVWGVPEPAQGTVRTLLGRHPQHRTMRAVGDGPDARPAVTDYTVISRYGWTWQEGAEARPRQRSAAAVHCLLQTGRTHQVRVHLQHLGHPLLGDPLYGDPERDTQEPGDLRALLAALPGQALHAVELAFDHPVSGVRVELRAALPPALQAVRDWLEAHPAGA